MHGSLPASFQDFLAFLYIQMIGTRCFLYMTPHLWWRMNKRDERLFSSYGARDEMETHIWK